MKKKLFRFLSTCFVTCALAFFVVSSSVSWAYSEKYLNLDTFLNVYVQLTTRDIDLEYKNIIPQYSRIDHLGNHKKIDEKSLLYDTLQRMIYSDLLPNRTEAVDFSVKIAPSFVAVLLRKEISSISLSPREYVDVQWTVDLVKQRLLEKQNQNKQKLKMINKTLKEGYLEADKIPDYHAYATISWFLSALWDPYTEYYSEQQAEKFNEMLNYSLVGIGAYLNHLKNSKVLIDRIIVWWGAESAGLKKGDIIVQVEDLVIQSTTKIEEIVQLLRGKEKTNVSIVVERSWQKLSFVVQRRKINVPAVESSKIENTDICRVDMLIFSMQSYQDFKTVLDGLKADSCARYVFDLRGNGWGSLQAVFQMLGYFVDKDTLLFSVVDRNGIKWYQLWYSYYNEFFKWKKIYLLIDKNSASASEIFVGVLREYFPEVVIVGEKSFGKWSVQELISYADGSMLKYTIAKWLIWKTNTFIGWVGIKPDINLVDDPSTEQDEVIEWVKSN